jgi:hypothetical protein
MARTKKVNGKAWKDISIVPRETIVTLKTVRGIVCEGKVQRKAKFMKPYRGMDKRIPAKRLDLRPPMQGDVRAVAWR